MKILMLARALPAHKRGGVPDHTWMLARGLAARGAGVHIVTTRLEGGPAVDVSAGVTVHYLASTRPDSTSGGWWEASARSVASLHAGERFDVLHCQSSAGYGVINRGRHRELRLPAVVSQHGTYYDELVTRWRSGFAADPVIAGRNLAAMGVILWTIVRKDLPYLRTADAVIATSNEQHRLLRRVYGVAAERLHTVYNGMDLRLFAPGPPDAAVRAAHGFPPDAPLLLVVARLIRDKGVQNAIGAMPEILRRIPGCRLLVVGEGPYRAPLERLAVARGVAASVRFAGELPLESLPPLFRSCDLFVNATNQQNGYDLTMVAAMACGRTVVSSDIGSTRTLISEGSDGVLVPPGDVGALARVAAELLSDARRREAIGGSAREKVHGRFDLDRMVSGTMEVYEAVRRVRP